jgi:hypothetical protein
VDRFYTPFKLLEKLEDNRIKMTGTVMGNRLPIRIQIPKNSKKFKEMECGDVEIFKLVY